MPYKPAGSPPPACRHLTGTNELIFRAVPYFPEGFPTRLRQSWPRSPSSLPTHLRVPNSFWDLLGSISSGAAVPFSCELRRSSLASLRIFQLKVFPYQTKRLRFRERCSSPPRPPALLFPTASTRQPTASRSYSFINEKDPFN